jgi:hypothetical protein
MPEAAGGEGGHGAARPHGVIHRPGYRRSIVSTSSHRESLTCQPPLPLDEISRGEPKQMPFYTFLASIFRIGGH